MKKFTEFLLSESVELNESSMTRFLSKFKNHDAVIITAFRKGVIKRIGGKAVQIKNEKGEKEYKFEKIFTKNENRERNKELFSALFAKGYSITKVKGSYIENYDGNKDERAEKYEESFVVVNHKNDKDFFNICKALAKKYDQDSILLIRKGDKPEAILFGTNDTGYPGLNKHERYTKLGVNKLDVQFFTRLGGSKLYFTENFDMSCYPQGSLGRMACTTQGNKILESLDLSEYDETSTLFPLTESSMTRFLEKFKKYDSIILTAWRKKEFRTDENGRIVKDENGKPLYNVLSRKQNKQRNRDLFAMLHASGYSVTSVKGSYIEEQELDGVKEKSSVEKYEESFVVVNHNDDKDFIRKVAKMARKFSQDSILVIEQGEQPKAYLLGTNKMAKFPGLGKKYPFGKLKLNNDGTDFFTRLGGKTFHFLDDGGKSLNENSDYDLNNLSYFGRVGIKSYGRRLLESLDEIDDVI